MVPLLFLYSLFIFKLFHFPNGGRTGDQSTGERSSGVRWTGDRRAALWGRGGGISGGGALAGGSSVELLRPCRKNFLAGLFSTGIVAAGSRIFAEVTVAWIPAFSESTFSERDLKNFLGLGTAGWFSPKIIKFKPGLVLHFTGNWEKCFHISQPGIFGI